MNKVRHQYFRFNARTAKITTIYMVVVPSIIGYIAWKTDVCVGPKDNPSPFMLFELVAKLTVLWNKGYVQLSWEVKGRYYLRPINGRCAAQAVKLVLNIIRLHTFALLSPSDQKTTTSCRTDSRAYHACASVKFGVLSRPYHLGIYVCADSVCLDSGPKLILYSSVSSLTICLYSHQRLREVLKARWEASHLFSIPLWAHWPLPLLLRLSVHHLDHLREHLAKQIHFLEIGNLRRHHACSRSLWRLCSLHY